MAQNTEKQEHSVFFSGQHSRQRMASLNGTAVLPGSTRPVARHLGPHLDDIMGSIRPELERRRAAAFRTWTRFLPSVVSCGRPTASSAPFFPGAGGLLSVYGSGSSSLLGLGRKMMRGNATISTKLEDGTERKRTVDRRKVWDFLGLVPRNFALVAFDGTRTL